jgi:hypothetical protein
MKTKQFSYRDKQLGRDIVPPSEYVSVTANITWNNEDNGRRHTEEREFKTKEEMDEWVDSMRKNERTNKVIQVEPSYWKSIGML